jgi:hypothetical protein
MNANNFALAGGSSKRLSVIRLLQLAYVELGHTAGALIDLVTYWAGHIELDNGSAFWTSSVHSAVLSSRPCKTFSSSATHRRAKEDAAVL